jgi:hypothetical protein
MGKVAVINYESSEITMSFVKWGILKRAMTSIGMMSLSFRLKAPAAFVPAYELALYDGSPRVVLHEQPYIIFYFANKQIAKRRLEELEEELQKGGLHGAISVSLNKIKENDWNFDEIGYMLGPKYYQDQKNFWNDVFNRLAPKKVREL